MNKQFEGRIKQIEDSVSCLHIEENTEQRESNIQEKQSEDGDLHPNVSIDIKRDAILNEVVAGLQKYDDEMRNSEHSETQVKSNEENGQSDFSLSEMATLNISVQDLEDHMVTDEQKQCYANWGAEHQILREWNYVVREEVLDVFKKIRSIIYTYNMYRKCTSVKYEVFRLLGSFETHKVDKDCRFPSHGVYVNITEQKLCDTMQEWIHTAIHAATGEERMWIFVDFAISRISKEVGDEGTENLLFDVDNFEAKYKLQWGLENDA